jgi:hypothetical protein
MSHKNLYFSKKKYRQILYNNQSTKISRLNLINFKKTKMKHAQDVLIFHYKSMIKPLEMTSLLHCFIQGRHL